MSRARHLLRTVRRSWRQLKGRAVVARDGERFAAWVSSSIDTLSVHDPDLARRVAERVAARLERAVATHEDQIVTMRDVHVLVTGGLEEALARRRRT